MIEISHLTKKYGKHTAVDDLSLTIEPGHIYGFLGPNGAGKSTTMNIITGYIATTEGSVKINGFDIYKDAIKAKKNIGYLPEIPPLYPDMTVLEYLTFVAELKQIPKKERDEVVDEACITTGVSDVAGRLIRNLSKGYKQRVGLAGAILGKPEIIILDEPTVGLDPAQIIEIRELIAELGKEHTVILSSHILTEISAVCDYVFIISKGKLVASDSTEKLLAQMSGSQEIELVIEGEKDITNVFTKLDQVESVSILPANEPNTTHIRISSKSEDDIRSDIFKTAVENGLIILKTQTISKSLEDVFLELTDADMVEADEEDSNEVSEAVEASEGGEQ